VIAATSWQDWVLMAGTLASAAAALGALYFAWRTVTEARALRRDESIQQLAGLVTIYGGTIRLQHDKDAHPGGPPLRGVPIPTLRIRLRAAIASAGGRLPACEALVALDQTAAPKKVVVAVDAALDELTAMTG
jgi:hypothetical protein